MPFRSNPDLEMLLNALGVAVYTTDATGAITFFNEAAVTFWGRRPEPGEAWNGAWRLFHAGGQSVAPEEDPIATALTEDRAISGAEGELERPDGSRGAFISYPAPLHNGSGEVIGAINVLVDVTERRKTEEALWTAAEALAASNVVKDEFLGLVSHELRTPVTTIFGNAQLLREKATLADAERQAMLADIAEESSRLHGIIENLLLLTRLGSGSDLDLEPQLIGRVVRSEAAAFERHHSPRALSLWIDPSPVVVEADRSHLEMLLDNLLSNADKYSPPESPIEVVVTSEGNEAMVTVLDRGIGIEDADESKLFTAFYRTEAAKTRTNGLGIGLAVCQRIVDSLGGRVWAQPREGGGTEAGFALPLAEATAD